MKWDWWIVLGLLAQGMFTMRFWIQWIASERRKESYIPTAFWFFSLMGSALLLIYSIHRKDPVFILGQSTGFLIYSRNLYFIYSKKSGAETEY